MREEANQRGPADPGNPAKPQGEKKWTKWSVVSVEDGSLRCKRTNAEDKEDAEYRQVTRPVFTQGELAGMIEFGKLELMDSTALAGQCYECRYRELAFRLCARLNAEAR